MMVKRLDFLVLGAQKCATTWLHSCLVEHPELYLPPRKREVEYLGGDLFEVNGSDWYFSMFEAARQDQKIGDVSVEYLFDSRSPEIVAKYLPDVKLIVSLRDPIDRAISAFYWYLRKGKIPELDLTQGLTMALEILQSVTPPNITGGNNLVDILRRGFYDEQIERYLHYFDGDQFLTLLYEDIDNNPQSVLKTIYTYLGVKSDFVPRVVSAQPKQNTYFKPLIALQRSAPNSVVVGKTLDILNQTMNRIGLRKQKPELPASLQDRLRQLYAPHNQRLRSFLADISPEQRTRLDKVSWML
jgi:hypothetical protein